MHPFIPTMLLLKGFPIHISHLNNSLSKILIPSQRFVTMSVSLCTRTVLHCLIIQVLNIKSLFPKYFSHFCNHNLEHGLAILTESFSPLRSSLHNLSCWSPKQKWHDKPCYPWYCLLGMCNNWQELVWASHNQVSSCSWSIIDADVRGRMPGVKSPIVTKNHQNSLCPFWTFCKWLNWCYPILVPKTSGLHCIHTARLFHTQN